MSQNEKLVIGRILKRAAYHKQYNLHVGDYVVLDYSGISEKPHPGVVTHLFPWSRQAQVQFPWGVSRYAIDTLLKINKSEYFYAPMKLDYDGYEDWDTQRSEKLYGKAAVKIATKVDMLAPVVNFTISELSSPKALTELHRRFERNEHVKTLHKLSFTDSPSLEVTMFLTHLSVKEAKNLVIKILREAGEQLEPNEVLEHLYAAKVETRPTQGFVMRVTFTRDELHGGYRQKFKEELHKDYPAQDILLNRGPDYWEINFPATTSQLVAEVEAKKALRNLGLSVEGENRITIRPRTANENKSVLEDIAREIETEPDLEKAKKRVIEYLGPLTINPKDKQKILFNVQQAPSSMKLLQFLWNAALKFRGVGVIKLSDEDNLAFTPDMNRLPEDHPLRSKDREFDDEKNRMNLHPSQWGDSPVVPLER